jgi:hypothetical protein
MKSFRFLILRPETVHSDGPKGLDRLLWTLVPPAADSRRRRSAGARRGTERLEPNLADPPGR